MSATSRPPRSRADGFTVADLHALPDDGPRYELIDGSLIVSPSATLTHNAIARWIANFIEDACPEDKWLVGTDRSASISDRSEPRPDIVVTHVRNASRTPFPITDALMVGEVVSPSSKVHNTETKRGVYAEQKVPAYWIIVPDEAKGVIALAELRLDGATYRYETHFTSDVFETTYPWPVRIDLPELSRRYARILELAG